MVAAQETLPQPIVFSLDDSERARLRDHLLKATGVRGQILSYVFLASIGILNGVLFARLEGWRSTFAWGVIAFYGVYFVSMTWQTFERCTIPPHSKTTLTFDRTSFSLETNDPRVGAKRILCARVRSVRSTSEALAIYGILRPYTVIPRSALPDDGAQLMRFFADRIVSQGLSETTRRGVTTLDNTITPLFARG